MKIFMKSYFVMLIILMVPELLEEEVIFSRANLLLLSWLTIFAIIISLPLVEKNLRKIGQFVKIKFLGL